MGQLTYRAKIRDRESIRQAAFAAKAEGKKVVFCHGCFDLVHPGHVRHLAWAKEQGDLLIVSLSGDSEVHKGDDRPFFPEELRAENLAALSFVDLVYIEPRYGTFENLEYFRPDVYVKGKEYADPNDPRLASTREAAARLGIELRFSPDDVVFSSTRVLNQQPAVDETERLRHQMLFERYGYARAKMLRALKAIVGKRALIVGEITLGERVDCEPLGTVPGTAILQIGTGERHYSVAAAKSMWNYIHELGGSPTLISVIGNDQTGEQIQSEVAGSSVHLILDSSRSSIRRMRYWCQGEAKLDVLTANYHPLAPSIATTIWREVEARLPDTDVVIAADFSYGLLNSWLIERICGIEKLGIPVIADVQCASNYGSILRYRGISLTKPNEFEARHSAMDFHSSLDDLGWKMLNETGNRCLVISRGAKGMRIFGKGLGAASREGIDRPVNLPSLATKVVDPTGAGDSALAMLALAQAANVSILDAAFLASAAAAQVVAGRGDDNPISQAVLEQQIHQWLVK